MLDTRLWEDELRHGHFRLCSSASGGVHIDADGYRINSHFTPLQSRAHGRPAGHIAECLAEPRQGQTTTMDRTTLLQNGRLPALHMTNYRQREDKPGWLLLPTCPAIIHAPQLWPPVPQELFSSSGYAPGDLMLTIDAEAASADLLHDFTRFHQALGFLVGLEGFGRNGADLNKIGRMRPNLVLLPAGAWVSNEIDALPAAALTPMIQLIHETGAMVGVTDIATDAQLQQVLLAGADLLSGPACPQRQTLPDAATPTTDADHQRLAPMIRQALADIDSGRTFESACESLLAEPRVRRCYLLDAAGTQLSDNLAAVGVHCDARYWPLANARGACWAHREYFQLARAQPGQVVSTRAYLSIPDGSHCLTLALGTRAGDQWVLCCDLTADVDA